MDVSRISKSLRTCLIGIIAVFGIGSVSSALANPPMKVPFGPFQVLGGWVGDCGTFQVLNDFALQGHFIVHFDKDGNDSRVNQRMFYGDSTYYNSEFPDVRLNGNPGTGENDHFLDLTSDQSVVVVTGVSFKINIPGHGVIFHEVGRTIFEYIDWQIAEILFQAGPSDFSDGNLAALCEALTP